MFALTLDRRGRDDDATGEIVVGDFRESFLINLSYWNVDDYQASWLRSAVHVLERGYGRFLASVTAPGQRTYITWVCRVRDGEPVFHKSFVLPSETETYRQPEDGETPAEDYAERNQDEPTLHCYRCALRDIAEFELRLRGGSAN